MTRLAVSLQPLPARYRTAATVLLECRRFSADALLVAADAFEEAGRAARLERAPIAADQATRIAESLRCAAPSRARYAVPPLGHVCSPELAMAMRDLPT